MRIVPVLDLQRGVVVHARRGDRAGYAPLRSPLVEGSEPVAVARALCAHTGSERLYVADLDAIAGAAADVRTLRRLSAVAELWVDAGATSSERAAALGGAGAARNVIGTESLAGEGASAGAAGNVIGTESLAGEGASAGAAGNLVGADSLAGDESNARAGPPLVLSVDLRDGRLISPRSELDGAAPEAAVGLVEAIGARELLVIDLALVGSRAGPPLEAVAALAAALPGVEVYAGGGVRGDHDLDALARAGAAGALVATALHEGTITI